MASSPRETVDTVANNDPDARGIMTSETFDSLPLCELLQKSLKMAKFTRMTEIQSKAIPAAIAGKDVLGKAKTGSGKTLAFLVPILDGLYSKGFQFKHGTGAIIIAPTRELAAQIYGVLEDISQHMPQTHCLLTGGSNRKSEATKLKRGCNIVVATPGRLLDHLTQTSDFKFDKLEYLVLDEADRMLEIGFEEELTAILRILQMRKQTFLFSATLPEKVSSLVKLSLRQPVQISAGSAAAGSADSGEVSVATVAGLRQGYIVCHHEDKFNMLFTFLKRHKSKKIMVFMSTCNAVKFYDEVFNYIDVPVLSIYGSKKQSSRTAVFNGFSKVESGILLCTDLAARGLDIPGVDWIVQFDPPEDQTSYIHRVGRTARGLGRCGSAVLFVAPEESSFIELLTSHGVPISKFEVPDNKIADMSEQFMKLVETNYVLGKSARDAFKSYMHCYNAQKLKQIFNVHALDTARVAKSFGLPGVPRVDLNIKALSKRKQFGNRPGFHDERGSKWPRH